MGWSVNRSDGNTVAILTRDNMNRQDPAELISIDVGEAILPAAKDSAERFAEKFSGTVAPLDFSIDGEPAFRVSIPPTYEQVAPRECIAVHHNGQVCFLIGGSKAQAEIWPTLKEIAQSWKWN